MTRQGRWTATIAVAAVAIAIGWTMRRAPMPAPGRVVLEVPAEPATKAAAPAAPADANVKSRPSQVAVKTSPAHSLPDSRTPLAEAVQTLRDYAEAGDNDAAIELSWRLSACTEHALSRSEESEESLRESIESDKTDENLTDDLRASRARNLQRQIDERVSEREACRALPPDLRADWLAWIDRAAQSGSTAAMRGYARMAPREYYSASDVLADVDTAIERRDKARAYLDEALQRGDAEALSDIAHAYSDSALPTIYPIDPVEAYAYAYAGTLAGVSRGSELDEIMEEAARSLDGRQLGEAEAEGQRIYAKCCAKH